MDKIFVIDASGYLYSSYFAIRNMTNSRGESTNALFGFIRSVQKLIKDFNPEYLVAVFDGPNNAKKRLEIYPEYKANRSSTPQDLPYQIDWAKEFCTHSGIPFLNLSDVEADDTMGAIAKWSKAHDCIVYLCTSDKDMAQLVDDKIFMLNTRKDNQIIGPSQVEEIYGAPPSKIIDLLAMIGDASDNVPGIPGIGPKTASSLLKEFGSLDAILANPEKISSEKRKQLIVGNKDKALLSRRLVTIDLSVEIPNLTSFYLLRPFCSEKLKRFYASMNFNSLIKELENSTTQKEKLSLSSATPESKEANGEIEIASKQAIQGELFTSEDRYILVDDEKDLNDLVHFLNTQKEICFDTETTSLKPLLAKLVGISFAVKPHEAWYIPFNSKLSLEYILNVLKPLFENSKIGFYGHNIKYDCHILENYGIEVANICFDTLLASYLLNSHIRQHSLDALSLQYFGEVKISIEELIGKGKKQITMAEVPISQVCTYGCEDVDYTCRLKEILSAEIKERGLNKLIETVELPLMKVLLKMERKGIFLDKANIKQTSIEILKLIEEKKVEIYNLAGVEFNINSTKQLSDILQNKLGITLPKKTATGFSTNADVLEVLSENHKIAEIILEYRVLEKLRSTYLENLSDEINPNTLRIHSNFNQSIAATGRLSSQDPNLQNIPVRTEIGREIRAAFKPQLEDWSYLSSDYSQIELRLLAHFSEDETLLSAFRNNEDIHKSTAAAILNIPLDEVTKEQRYQAKAVNFGIIYGQQAFGLARELKIDVKTAANFIDAYFKKFSRVKKYLENCKMLARKSGRATTYIGRERLIPEIHSKNANLRMFAERLAVNTPLQGTAADLIKLAMLKIDEELKNRHLKSYMILQIHDELIFEVPNDELEVLKPLVKEAMQSVFELKVPLIVDITIGKNWKEC